jgi:arylsulfatase A-like enzyme
VPRQVRLADVAPTILTLAGHAEPRLFARQRTAGPDPARTIVPPPDASLPAFADLHGWISAIRTPESKLVVDETNRKTSLYDLVIDPREQLDRKATDPSVSRELGRRLERYRSAWSRFGRPASSFQLDPGHREQLRSLGYLR